VPYLPIAVRAFTERAKEPKARRKSSQDRETGWPRDVVILDTETTIDKTQQLMLGSYRFCRWSEDGTQLECLEEGLLYDDALPKTDPEGFACLREYAKDHSADVTADVPQEIQLLSRTEFVEAVLYRVAYEGRAMVVGFNLPFDLSRLAVRCGAARGRFRGGFSLVLGQYRKKKRGPWRPHPYRSRIRIQHGNSKRSFIEFDRPRQVHEDDQRPVNGAAPDPRYSFPGHFLDLKTLAFALTNEAYKLERACEAFGVAHPKTKPERHGVITPEYIDYNRRDVLASQELLEKLREEFDRHPIDLDPCKAYSPASIAKAYLRKMGLRPPAEQFRRFPRRVMGYAMSAFYGGRAECRIRKKPVPVVYTDFLSMYPTVQILLGLWDVLTAQKLEVVEAIEEIQELLDRASLEDIFRPDFWQELRGFAELVPEGEILPIRARHHGTEWTVGVNHLTAEAPLWFAIPDLVASKLFTGRAPKIRRAFRLVPKGRQASLRTVRLRGVVPVDPRRQNLFKTVIEERQRIKKDPDLSEAERDRMQLLLKTFANAGSFGIFVEMNRKPLRSGESETLSVYGREGGFESPSRVPEEPGPFCFPPMASLITAGARLMLALLERCVTDAGGTYAFADTDSMAIVASESGGLLPCDGGPYRLPDGTPAIRALSWGKVDSIMNRFQTLNPYDRKAVPQSILKIEEVNFDPETGKQRPVYAFAISAKRYALFTIDSEGHPEVIKGGYSEHGLGQLLNPLDPDSDEKKWIRLVWQGIVGEALGGPRFKPEWANRPAVMRSSVSTWDLHHRFDRINRKRPYAKQVKPFNFLLSVTVDSLECPPGACESGGLHVVAPYSSNPSEWRRIPWTDLHSGREYRIKTHGHSNRAAIRVQTFGDVLERFRYHPESKSAGPDGLQAGKGTVGLLGRLHVRALSIAHIGKETNLLEQQEEGMLTADPQAVYLGKADFEAVRSLLKRVAIPKLAARSGVSERMLQSVRQGKRQFSAKTLSAIMDALEQMLDEGRLRVENEKALDTACPRPAGGAVSQALRRDRSAALEAK